MLFRVLREGLWFRECLGLTRGRANTDLETVSRTPGPGSGAAGEGTPRTAASWVPALVRLHRQLRWIVAFSCLP